MKIYLAHPFGTRKLVREWQLVHEKTCKHTFVNPFYDSAVEQEIVKRADEGAIDHLFVLANVNPKLIVEEDVKMILDADMVIAYIDGSTSYGTIMEIVYAYINKKRIVAIITNGYMNHPWLRYHCSAIYTSFAEMTDEELR